MSDVRDPAAALMAALAPVEAASPVSDVATRMLDLFTSGEIAPGTRLPAERQLATALGVGRSAVREALAALEILGIVTVRPGSGTYLRGSASELLPSTLSWGLLIGERSTAELIELRSGLEIYVARLAAERVGPVELERLATELERMRTSEGDLVRFAQADSEFHRELAAVAGNAVLIDLLHLVRSLLRVYSDRAVHDLDEVATAIDEHAAIYRALESANPDEAASAMAVHMGTAARRLGGIASLS